MGIKNFYHVWYKHRFKCIGLEKPNNIDVLAIDINGLFYSCSQQVYKHENPIILFKKVCQNIDFIRQTINPQKKFIICVDGVAGLGKMNQQRLRRHTHNRNNNNTNSYNTNCFTPGTELLNNMTRYIDWYIRNMLSCSPEWQKLEVIFSNEKVPGEGEHKIMKYIKSFVSLDQTICIYGCDADLILLTSLLSHTDIHIAREYNGIIEFINISTFKQQLIDLLRWNDPYFNDLVAIQDFVFILSLVGNDFLPTISCLPIIYGAIDLIINAYVTAGSKYGHLTCTNSSGVITIHKISVTYFFKLLTYYENNSISNTSLSCATSYLDGMLWTINYYANGIPDWRWCFQSNVPLLRDLYRVVSNYIPPCFVLHKPMDPFLQLMVLLPRSDQYLLPTVMIHSFTFYPRHKKLNYSNVQEIEIIYHTVYEPYFTIKERKRNQIGKVFKYIFCAEHSSPFKSLFGDITHCKTIVTTIF